MSAKADSLRRIADALELQNQPVELLKQKIAEQQAEIDHQTVELERARAGWRGWHAAAEQLRETLEARRQHDLDSAKTARADVSVLDEARAARESLRKKISECIELGLDLREARAKVSDLENSIRPERKAARTAEAKLAAYHDPWDEQRARYEKKIVDLRNRLAGKNSKLAYWKSKAASLSRTLENYRNANTRR